MRDLLLVMDGQTLVEFHGVATALQGLTQVTGLHLKYDYIHTANQDFKLWGNFSALVDLEFNFDLCEDDAESGGWGLDTATDVLAGIRAAHALTRLDVVLAVDDTQSAAAPVEVCHYLSGLTKLQSLRIKWDEGHIAARDCMHLSSLRGITNLSLQYMDDAVDDTVAVALVANMPALRQLDLTHCGLRTDAVLPLLAQRPLLTRLELTDNDGISERLLADIDAFNSTGQPRLSSLLLQPHQA